MPTSTQQPTLADYENPPVVESVLGVQFERLRGFKNAHLGAFWTTLDKKEWPVVADAPPLPPQFERFTESAKWAKGLQIQFSILGSWVASIGSPFLPATATNDECPSTMGLNQSLMRRSCTAVSRYR